MSARINNLREYNSWFIHDREDFSHYRYKVAKDFRCRLPVADLAKIKNIASKMEPKSQSDAVRGVSWIRNHEGKIYYLTVEQPATGLQVSFIESRRRWQNKKIIGKIDRKQFVELKKYWIRSKLKTCIRGSNERAGGSG